MVTVRNVPALILTVRMEENNVHTVLVQIIIVKVVSSVHILRALVSIMVRKVVNVNTVPVQTIIAKVVSSVLILRVPAPEDIIAKVVSSVHILRVPVLTAVKVVNSVLTLRVLVPAVIISRTGAIGTIVSTTLITTGTRTIRTVAALIITRMQSIV